jgi:hypothetical protein
MPIAEMPGLGKPLLEIFAETLTTAKTTPKNAAR